ncbi:MAG: SURF1 family protein [Halioglobus sp.]|nr:SURF1 family protein [Halioglobus sp.]
MSAGIQFDFEWRTTLFALVMVPALAGLGFWQLSRAEEKAVIAQEFENKRARAPAALEELAGKSSAELAYHPVRLSGRFRQQEYFLQDNRLVQGRYGNEVLGVFERAEGGLALVNRGWIVADPARQSLPAAPVVEGPVTITGQVYVAPGAAYMLAEDPYSADWPIRVQALDMDKAAAALDVPAAALFAYPVRMDEGQAGALYIDWPVVNVGPQKHIGYAVQWFAMSVVLAVLFVVRSTNLLALWRGRQK